MMMLMIIMTIMVMINSLADDIEILSFLFSHTFHPYDYRSSVLWNKTKTKKKQQQL